MDTQDGVPPAVKVNDFVVDSFDMFPSPSGCSGDTIAVIVY
jgi:hypothetical protein